MNLTSSTLLEEWKHSCWILLVLCYPVMLFSCQLILHDGLATCQKTIEETSKTTVTAKFACYVCKSFEHELRTLTAIMDLKLLAGQSSNEDSSCSSLAKNHSSLQSMHRSVCNWHSVLASFAFSVWKLSSLRNCSYWGGNAQVSTALHAKRNVNSFHRLNRS